MFQADRWPRWWPATGEGLAITAETNRITWAGEPIEYGWAVEALMPRSV